VGCSSETPSRFHSGAVRLSIFNEGSSDRWEILQSSLEPATAEIEIHPRKDILPKFNMDPKNEAGISYSRVSFSGSMLNIGRVT